MPDRDKKENDGNEKMQLWSDCPICHKPLIDGVMDANGNVVNLCFHCYQIFFENIFKKGEFKTFVFNRFFKNKKQEKDTILKDLYYFYTTRDSLMKDIKFCKEVSGNQKYYKDNNTGHYFLTSLLIYTYMYNICESIIKFKETRRDELFEQIRQENQENQNKNK